MEGEAQLILKDMGIDTHQEPVVYMRVDCHVCRAEGFTASTRVALKYKNTSVIATLNVVDQEVLPSGHVGASKIAMQRLNAPEGSAVIVDHAPVVASLSSVRKKVFGHKLSDEEIFSVIQDISLHRYSDIEIATFLSASAGSRLDVDEIIGLTSAMVACGKKLTWPGVDKIFDKHCIGGLPGNRTTPLVVSIVSAAGLVIPKTSSRAITSPAGTADTMEALTNVNLGIEDIRRVVSQTGACLAWGGAVNLSPADDLLIRIERALELDGEGQLIASVLSKKIAAGSTHAVIDIPVGDTAKIRTKQGAERLASLFTQVGAASGIKIRCVITDGSQPIGCGVGPVEEARDLLAILKREPQAPADLRERALYLAANIFDMASNLGFSQSYDRASKILSSGEALTQFEKIMAAQGGIKDLPIASFQHVENSPCSGVITAIDNRQLSRLAKLAGAPQNAASGVRLRARVGDVLTQGDPLFTLYSDSLGELEYALDYYRNLSLIFTIKESL